eukprot:COSAG01_NODE_8622_length_2716_cov_3.927780_5_plen_106_part_00
MVCHCRLFIYGPKHNSTSTKPHEPPGPSCGSWLCQRVQSRSHASHAARELGRMHSAMKRAAGGGGGEATVRKRLSAKRRPLVTGDTLRETGRGAFLSVERGVSVG